MTEVINEKYDVSEPYTYKNLSVFLIHGEDKIKDKSFLTLQEAMEQRKLIVHETGMVKELTVENVSADEEVFIQSGDIVKGGRQDRVFAFDFVIPVKSGKIPVAAYCVEKNRWHQRGSENSGSFSASTDRSITRELNIAIKHTRSQNEVWSSVSNTQDLIAGSLGHSVRSRQSESSLQLTLENERIQHTSEDYFHNLASIIDGNEDALGYAFAINGKIHNADVYVSNALFRKLWQKLLKAAVLEAIIHAPYQGVIVPWMIKDSDAYRAGLRAGDIIFEIDGQPVSSPFELLDKVKQYEYGKAIPLRVVRNGNPQRKKQRFEQPTIDAVQEFLAKTSNAQGKEQKISQRIKMITYEIGDTIRFETHDLEEQVPIHSNHLTKPNN
jgi:hypothetical protein